MTTNPGNLITILMADDDPDDRQLTREALAECRLANEIHFVEDGEQLMDYLLRKGAYANLASAKLPGLILLDLNMPRKDGREALKEIKQHPVFKKIPIIVFTTTKNENEIKRCYELGANTYIVKPVSFDGLLKVLDSIRTYWSSSASIPW